MHELRTSFKELTKKTSQHLKRVEVLDKSFVLKKKKKYPQKSGVVFGGKVVFNQGVDCACVYKV